MKKTKSMKILALTMAMTLAVSMSAITASASEDTNPNARVIPTEEATTEIDTAETVTTETVTVEATVTDEAETVTTEAVTVEATVTSEIVSDPEDVDSLKAGLEEETEDTTVIMNADVTNDEASVVKTGETNIIPIIVGLAVVAVAAGAGYVIYRKRQDKED